MEKNDVKDPNAVEENPHIPIKTYQWEDVKRARKKGGYPWTHLTKPPFDEEVDAEAFTMDAYRRSRSSSTIGKCSLQDISEGEQVDNVSDQDQNVDTQGLLGINPQSIAKSEESFVNKKDLALPKTSIAIHIQQEELPENNENLLSVSNSSIGPSKKRKLSVESSHSRISLSKLAIKDKLKSAKEKLKLPKLIKRSKSDVQEIKKPKVQKTENKGFSYYQGKSEPVYIHIPLKLPPGETDEYSKYEFESRPASRSASLTHLTHFGSGKRKLSLLGLLTELKRLYDDQAVASESNQETPSDATTSKEILDTETNSKHAPEKLNIDEIIDKRKHKLKRSSKKSTQELKEMLAASPDTNEISQYIDKEDKYEIITTEIPNLDIDCVIITDYDEASENKENHSNVHESPDGWSELNLDKDIPSRVRAKSEEPKRKRKSSIDSSYSRKSLSKLAFIKKIKNVKDSIKLPKFLSFPKLDTTPKTITTTEATTSFPKQSEVLKISTKQSTQPLYIHIPLKLPEGQQDEFSHLAGNNIQTEPATNISKQDKTIPECETPITPVASGDGVQLIFLTPPSDDEILDSSIPETPSETNQKFFESVKVDELKSIAKKAVDFIYPGMIKLEIVEEDEKSDTGDVNGIATEGGTTYWQMHPVLVDEEDGLKLSDAAIAMINEEMAKELTIEKEEAKPSPQLKKKVSFKRAKAQDGERIYEDVGLSVKPSVQENETFRSMSTEEEKTYLDEKVIKTTSLDEDYNKWSQITDHEYEPVFPPPDEDIKLPNLTNAETTITLEHPKHITFNEQLTSDTASETHMETPTAQALQDQIENRFFKTSPVALPKISSKSKQPPTTDAPQPPTSTKKKDKSPSQHSEGNKFNNAIKMQAEKIKNKLQGIKRPHINFPQPPKFSTATFSKLKLKKPKMPELPSIKLASLKRNDSKNSWRKRQFSTESNAGDSKTKKFSFKTYPRIFEKSKVLKQSSFCDSFDKTTSIPVFSTVPRVKTKPQKELVSEIPEDPKEYYYDKDRGFVTIPIDQDGNNALHLQSPMQYNQDINIDDDFNDSGDDIKSHELPLNIKGHLTTKKKEANITYFTSNINGDAGELHSDQSSPSLSDHRQGVLEEIDSDQFFLREKGISQDDIDVGQYLSSEIKEAFRNPINALTHFQSEEREYDVDITDQSQSSEEIPKRKWIKKPKRKKTPHVSNEQLSFEFGSDPEDYATKHKVEYTVQAPTRPKRRSKKNKKKKFEVDNIVPYQETIPFVELQTEQLDFIGSNQSLPCEVVDYVESSDTYKNESVTTDHFYINTQDEELQISPPMYINFSQDIENDISEVQPIRPLRKNKNVKNVNAIEVDSCADRNVSIDRSINSFEESARIEDIGYQNTPPCRPDRKRSNTRSESESSFLENFPLDHDLPPTRPIRLRSSTRSKSTPSVHNNLTATPPPVRPTRFRSRTRSESTESLPGSQDLSSFPDTNVPEVICIEETRIQIICDPMGYAVVDKSKIRDPPLPPSRFPQTPPRTRRRKKPHSTSGKFATVPRPPSRPLRNYSTLNKPTSTSSTNVLDDDKENIDINPYIEIDEDELARRLQSGEVIQKMRERPLPAPPRPPRKAKTPTREILRDISHERNLPRSNSGTLDSKHSATLSSLHLFELEQQILTDDHEETITHGALVVQPIGRSTALSYSDVFNIDQNSALEKTVLIEQNSDTLEYHEPCDNIIQELPVVDDELPYQPTVDSDDEEMSEIPDEFYRLNPTKSEAHETLALSEPSDNLQEFDTNEPEVDEIDVLQLESMDTNTLILDKKEIPEKSILEILEQLQKPFGSCQNLNDAEEEVEDDLPELIDETEPPPVPPRSDSVGNLVDVITEDKIPSDPNRSTNFTDSFVPQMYNKNEDPVVFTDVAVSEIPIRPPRRCSQTEKQPNHFNLTPAENRLINTQENECLTHLSPDQSVMLLENNSTHEVSIEQVPHEDVLPSEQGNTNSTNENALPDQESTGISRPPQSFYNLQSSIVNNFDGTNIPLQTCSTCHHKFTTLSRSSSSEVLYQRQRRPRRLSEPSIPELTGQLVQACSVEIDRSLRDLTALLSDNFLSNTERKEDLKVILLMLVILIASLILMNGDKVEHHHHWDYFNPPKEF